MWSNKTDKKLTKRLNRKINELYYYADEKHLLIKRLKKIVSKLFNQKSSDLHMKKSVFIHIFLIHLMVKTNNNNTTKAIYNKKYDLAQNYNGSFIISFFFTFYLFFCCYHCMFIFHFVCISFLYLFSLFSFDRM